MRKAEKIEKKEEIKPCSGKTKKRLYWPGVVFPPINLNNFRKWTR